MRVFRFLMVLMLPLVSPVLRAQTAAELLNWTRTHLDRGNCDEARETYALYKEKVPQGNSEVERRIAECRGYSMQETKKYSIGDDAKDFVGEEGYKIAYLDASGRHGFAIKTGKNAWGKSPTMDDCRILYRNKYSLGLTGEYWTDEEDEFSAGLIWHVHNVFRTFDFSTGKTHSRAYNKSNENHIGRMSVLRF
jgi:hypothetical protein